MMTKDDGPSNGHASTPDVKPGRFVEISVASPESAVYSMHVGGQCCFESDRELGPGQPVGACYQQPKVAGS